MSVPHGPYAMLWRRVQAQEGGTSAPGPSALSASTSGGDPDPLSIVKLRFSTILPPGISKEEAYDSWLRFAWREDT